jgi:hypothetical protein
MQMLEVPEKLYGINKMDLCSAFKGQYLLYGYPRSKNGHCHRKIPIPYSDRSLAGHSSEEKLYKEGGPVSWKDSPRALLYL